MSNAKKLARAWARPFQAIEDAANALIRMFDVRHATGIWLTRLGNFVGQPRQGIADDDVYRRYVIARILTNKSDGQPETMYAIARRILGDEVNDLYGEGAAFTLRIDNQGHAGFVMRVGGVPIDNTVARIIIAFLRQAASAGVRVILEFMPEDPDNDISEDCFTFGGDGFAPDSGNGFASLDATSGGFFADSIE